MKRPVIAFDEAQHRYTVNGEAVPFVTGIIARVLGTGFENLRNAEFYMSRGRSIHAAAALICRGQDQDFEFPDEIKGHVEAVRSFWRNVNPVAFSDLVEQPSGSALYRFAGTPDLPCTIGPRAFIVDYKSSLEEFRLRLQLGGYSLAIKETHGVEIHFGIGVHLRGDGTYRMTKPIDLRPARNDFLHVLAVYRMMEKLEKQPKENDDA